MGGDKSLEEKLYELLQTDTYKTDVYNTWDLGEGMAVLHKNFWGWYKPWFVMNHNKKNILDAVRFTLPVYAADNNELLLYHMEKCL